MVGGLDRRRYFGRVRGDRLVRFSSGVCESCGVDDFELGGESYNIVISGSSDKLATCSSIISLMASPVISAAISR